MKKSKLLQNSKDLLSRSFNPAKCKTSLRLAGSRLKLLRNKKDVQLKQMNREIAQLLQAGQDQTARIRVEHVMREEKMMAAYDLLEIYCELVVARLPIIESQKNCPIDLKEAIASLVFAAPRCGDVPELLDVRKQITAKYGKEFTTAAIELRPQCGVGRMLIEKLSATAPDGQTKLKLLTAIAEGHNVKWDPKSFGDKDYVPQNDLLGGPSSLTKESEQYVNPPHFEAANVQAHPNNNNVMMQTPPSNFSLHDDRTSVGPEKLVSAQNPGLSTPFQSEARPAALRNERGQENRNSSSSMDSPLDRSRWHMEFKDATSAAQAAAESAELASMAARAAAELSSHGKISGQYSTEILSHGRISSQYSTEESRQSNVNILKDEGPDAHPNSKLMSEHTKLKNEKVDGIKPNDPKMAKTFMEDDAGSSQGYYRRSASLKSKASADDSDNALDHGTTGVDEYYSQKSSLKDDKMRDDKHSFRYETESANNWPEKAENVKEGRIEKEHSIKSSCSQSSISEDVNIFSNSENQKFENDAGGDFVGIGKIGCVNGEAPQKSSHASAALFIEKSDSDIDNDYSLFDKGPTYDDQELDSHLSSSFGQKSPEVHTDSWLPGSSSSSKIVNSTSSLFFAREISPSPELSENMTLKDDLERNSVPLMFDESDGPISESDDEDMNTRHNKVDDSRDPLHNESSVFDSQNLPFSSDDEFGSSMETPSKRNQVSIFDDESSPDDSGGRLNFGKLTGGFRHKGHNHLPILKNRLDASSSSIKKEPKETTTTINTPTNVDERLERGTIRMDHKKNPRTKEDMHFESDSDFSEEEVSLPKNSGHKKALTPVMDVKTKSDSFFATDNSDLDEDSPKEESLIRKHHVRRSGISRRTKVSPSASKAESHTKTHLRSDKALDDSDGGGIFRKPTTSSKSETLSDRRNSRKWQSYEHPTSIPSKSSFWGPPENPGLANATSVKKHESEARDSDSSPGKKPSSSHSRPELDSRRNFSSLGNSEKPIPSKVASKPINSSLSGKATSTTIQESKISQKSSVVEPKAKASIGSENASSNKDETAKNSASHVHPKLPDYDTLFKSLRMNRT